MSVRKLHRHIVLLDEDFDEKIEKDSSYRYLWINLKKEIANAKREKKNKREYDRYWANKVLAPSVQQELPHIDVGESQNEPRDQPQNETQDDVHRSSKDEPQDHSSRNVLPSPSSSTPQDYPRSEEEEYFSAGGEEHSSEDEDVPLRKRVRRQTSAEKAEQAYQNIYKLILQNREFGLEIKRSSIDGAGDGVYATKDFEVNEYICEYKGDLIEKDEMKKREARYNEDPEGYGSFMFTFKAKGKQFCLDPTEGYDGTYGRMINHSRKNKNCIPIVGVYDYKYHVYFSAIKNIKSGDEIVFDYGEKNPEVLKQNPWLKN